MRSSTLARLRSQVPQRLALTTIFGASVMMYAASARSFMTAVDVTTYNVLSSHLAGEDYFTACEPRYLDESYRYRTLLKKLREDLDKRSIICLQEVSQIWESRLHAVFAKEGYYFITQLYGRPFNNYMGVGIAVPLDRYRIQGRESGAVGSGGSAVVAAACGPHTLHTPRLSDTKPWPRPPEPVASSAIQPAGPFQALWRFLSTPLRSILREAPTRSEDLSPWEKAKRRFNVQVSVGLEDAKDGRTFSVSTYHMPCMFRDPEVMTIHAALSAQHAERAAKGRPFILAGDFNFKETSPQYKMMTSGGSLPTDEAYPKPEDHEPWRPVLSHPLRSAYKEAVGADPDFTNWAKIRDSPEFIECIDYIFLSNGWRAHSVGATPSQASCPGPYPNREEPSDHVKLSASLELFESQASAVGDAEGAKSAPGVSQSVPSTSE